MKKCIALLLSMVMIASVPVMGEESTPNTSDFVPKTIDGFRGHLWGESLDYVHKNSIGLCYLEKYPDSLYEFNTDDHEVKIAGYDMMAVYKFEDDALTTGYYFPQDEYSDSQKYYTEYCDLVSAYKTVYGEPVYEQESWLPGSVFKGSPQYYGSAVWDGQVNFSTKWEDNTKDPAPYVTITLGANDHKMILNVTYRCAPVEAEPTTIDTDGI